MKNLYRYYYRRLPLRYKATDDQIYLLSEAERQAIQKLEWKALLLSGLIGTIAVLLLYLPQYFIPQLFPNKTINLPVLGATEIPIVGTIYGIVLVFLEIWALTLLHVYCIHHIGAATGFITEDSKNTKEKQEKILAVSTEEKDKTLQKFGINPYQGLKMSRVWLLNIFIALKATLSNMVVKILIRRFLGRYAVREVLDLVGIPIFAFWNMMATHTILREAKVMIMGQNLIDSFIPKLKETASKIKDKPEAKMLIYDTLQFIAMSKRDYHANHAYLTEKIFTIFDIPIENQHLTPSDYHQRLAQSDTETSQFCQWLIVVGLVLDGQISWRERKQMTQFNEEGILLLSVAEVVKLKDDFLSGKGLKYG